MANQEEEKVDSCALVNSRIILKQIQNTKNANTNILLSPLSFHAVLSMTAAGATGHTLNQMIQFLGVSDINELNSKFANMADVIDSNGNGGPDLSFLNGMWVAHTNQLRDSYKDLANAVYKTEPKVVDFKRKEEVVEEVNAWAESASRGLITEILKPKHITVILKVHGNLMKSTQQTKTFTYSTVTKSQFPS
ncbi:serpin-ZX-like [Capsicum annuum]|uniref:serpin-ZX-like n=1 Tax=Capsicum annuum TaxID=4072 RepID=UPI0007BFD299|nr:serpin-ZX-like [Capsicum annuum]